MANKLIEKKDLIFKVALQRIEWWDKPWFDDSIEWDGEQRVEQDWCAELTIEQFAAMCAHYQDWSESISTQGMQIEGGYLIPSVHIYEPDEENGVYVSVYTKEMLEAAIKAADEPAPTPVIEDITDDGRVAVRSYDMSFAYDMYQHFDKIQEALKVVCELTDEDADLIEEKLWEALSKPEVMGHFQDGFGF